MTVLNLGQAAHATADQRLRTEAIIWLTTVNRSGQPQSTPVDRSIATHYRLTPGVRVETLHSVRVNRRDPLVVGLTAGLHSGQNAPSAVRVKVVPWSEMGRWLVHSCELANRTPVRPGV